MLRFMNDIEGMEAFYGRAGFPHVMTVEVEDRATMLPHMFIFAKRDIEPEEEIILNYGDVSLPGHLATCCTQWGINAFLKSLSFARWVPAGMPPHC